MKKKIIRILGALIPALVFGLALAGCSIGTEPETETKTYTVTYDANGVATGSPPSAQQVEEGETISILGTGSMTPPSGKKFGGWKTDNQIYQIGAAYKVTRNVTFFAEWVADSTTPTDGVYAGFINYPTGQQDVYGLLKIRTTAATSTLLFTSSVAPENYIGTVEGLKSIQVKLPKDDFYTIVAVDKAIYEQKSAQASQYSTLTYYSSQQPYEVVVSPSNTYGAGTWIFNNNTNFWVSIESADGSGNKYAVLKPNAKRVSIPINIGQNYDFIPYFKRELKYDGKVIALVETTDVKQSDIASTTNSKPTFTTDIQNTDVGTNVEPAVMLKNTSGKTVRVYYSSSQVTNGSPGQDFTVLSGDQQLLSGFKEDDNTKNINFSNPAWSPKKYVSTSMVMQKNKVYLITLDADGKTTVAEEDSSKYYN